MNPNGLIGRKIRGDYESGIYTGTIDYYQSKFGLYHVTFGSSDEGDEDYIALSDINGEELTLF